MRSMVEKYLRQEKVSLKNFLEMGDHEAIKRTVEEHIGISLISRVSVQRELNRGDLIQVPLSRLDNIRRAFVLVSLREREMNYAERVFIELLKTQLAHFHG